MLNVKRYLSVYLSYLRSQLLGLIEYKVDFLIGVFSVIVEQILSLVFISVIFGNIEQLNGWDYYEILIIYSFSTLGRSIHIIFFDNMWVFGSKYIQNGEFDRILLRPINPLFQVISEKINYQGIGQVIIGVIALTISITNLNIHVDFVTIIKILFAVLFSGSIFVGIHLFYMTLSIWMIDSLPVVSSVFSLNQFAQYPITIFPKFIQVIVVLVVPYAFTGFIPANLFLHQNEYSTLIYLLPLVSVLLFSISYMFWNFGVKKYKSTGT